MWCSSDDNDNDGESERESESESECSSGGEARKHRRSSSSSSFMVFGFIRSFVRSFVHRCIARTRTQPAPSRRVSYRLSLSPSLSLSLGCTRVLYRSHTCALATLIVDWPGAWECRCSSRARRRGGRARIMSFIVVPIDEQNTKSPNTSTIERTPASRSRVRVPQQRPVSVAHVAACSLAQAWRCGPGA